MRRQHVVWMVQVAPSMMGSNPARAGHDGE